MLTFELYSDICANHRKAYEKMVGLNFYHKYICGISEYDSILQALYQSNFMMRAIFPRAEGKYKASRRLAGCNLKFIEYKWIFLEINNGITIAYVICNYCFFIIN
ncbi:hypothetical protein AFK69_16370 [Xenorhabdus sp. GDc328]|nr:hypothetical protein AAY47_09300 [Xenorhabdus griffiniae]KOP32273.1 hypothetical protein AFK69_16370 [Xenorhabdus sp. GDc328]